MRRATFKQYFHVLTLFDMTLTFALNMVHAYTYATFFIPWETLRQSLGSQQLFLVPSRQPVRRKVTILTFNLT